MSAASGSWSRPFRGRGVEDGSRKVTGVPAVTQAEERLANLVSDRIEPRLVPEIHILPWRKTHILAVEMFPGPTRPHYVKTLGLRGLRGPVPTGLKLLYNG
jgi:predicted HTH transcriptional regulator